MAGLFKRLNAGPLYRTRALIVKRRGNAGAGTPRTPKAPENAENAENAEN